MAQDKINILDLFAGIGGFSISAKWAFGKRANTIGFCEIDEHCCAVLTKRFPGVPIFGDVRDLNRRKINLPIDIVTGGFPCQDISMAGKGVGIEGERSGLWKEMFRIIGEFRPRFAIIENVSALTHRGLTVVLNDLAKIRYDAEWQCIQANQVGAKHKRERIWIVAYPSSLRLQCKEENFKLEGERLGEQGGRDGIQVTESGISSSNVARVVDGLPSKLYEYWDREPKHLSRVGKDVADREGRIKSLGNSIVPQIPYLIYKRLEQLGI